MYMKFQAKTLRLVGSKLVMENLGKPVIGRGNYQYNKRVCDKLFSIAMNRLIRNKRDTFVAFVILQYSTDRSKLNLKEANEI